LLASAGLSVAVVEALRVGRQVTGRSTAKITSQHSLIYGHLIETRGIDQAQLYAEANRSGARQICDWVVELGIACDLDSKAAYAYARDPARRDEIAAEAEAARRVGFDAELLDRAPLPFDTAGRRQVRGEERADLLVYFGGCEVQRFHQAVALYGSRLGNKPGLGFLVAEVLADDRDLGQDLSVVQHESRNVPLGVDLPIIAAVGGLLVGDVNPLEIEGVSGFASHDVRGHGAGAGGVVELHVQFLSGAVDWAHSRS
jgi:hypothetical protein